MSSSRAQQLLPTLSEAEVIEVHQTDWRIFHKIQQHLLTTAMAVCAQERSNHDYNQGFYAGIKYVGHMMRALVDPPTEASTPYEDDE